MSMVLYFRWICCKQPRQWNLKETFAFTPKLDVIFPSLSNPVRLHKKDSCFTRVFRQASRSQESGQRDSAQSDPNVT